MIHSQEAAKKMAGLDRDTRRKLEIEERKKAWQPSFKAFHGACHDAQCYS